MGYGADIQARDPHEVTSLHLILAKRSVKPLSEWTLYLNKVRIINPIELDNYYLLFTFQFHEYVSRADNSIQDVPVYITVACFLVSEGASLETKTVEEITPLMLCPSEYQSLLQLFATLERYYCF